MLWEIEIQSGGESRPYFLSMTSLDSLKSRSLDGPWKLRLQQTPRFQHGSLFGLEHGTFFRPPCRPFHFFLFCSRARRLRKLSIIFFIVGLSGFCCKSSSSAPLRPLFVRIVLIRFIT